MSNSADLTSVPTMSNSDTAGSSETSTGLNYQQALGQVKCLDLIYFKKNSSSVSPAPSSSKTRDSKYSHAGIIVNSEVLPGVAGMKTGSYYVLQTSGSGDVSSGDGSVAPAPDSTETAETSNGRPIKYYGIHLTELGTVLKRYTNADLSTGVAWARFTDNPLIQGANESSSKYKKRKKTLISQIEQFYQKSKARNLGRKIFGLMRKSTKRPEGLKFSHHILHSGSTYDAHRQNWSTHPIEQFYQHFGWLEIPEDPSEAEEDPESTSNVDPATVPVNSGVDVNWAAPTDPSTTVTTDPSTTATTDSSTTTTTDPSTVGSTDPSVAESGDATDPSIPDTPTITGTVDNLNNIVDPPTDLYYAPSDTFEDDGDYQDPNAADPGTPTETVDGADPPASATSSSTEPADGTAASTTDSSATIDPSTNTTPSVTTEPSTTVPDSSTTVPDSSTTVPDSSTTAPDSSTTPVAAVSSTSTTTTSIPDTSVASQTPQGVTAPSVTATTSASMISSSSPTVATSTPKYAAAPSTETEYW